MRESQGEKETWKAIILTLIQEVSDFKYELLICYEQTKQAGNYFQLTYEMQSHGQVAYILVSYLVKSFVLCVVFFLI